MPLNALIAVSASGIPTWVGARSEQPGPGREDGAAQTAEGADRLAGAAADLGDELYLAGVQLALDRAVDGTEPLLHRRGRVGLVPGHGVDEEKLLLDAHRERRFRAKGILDLIVGGAQGFQVFPGWRGANTRARQRAGYAFRRLCGGLFLREDSRHDAQLDQR